MYKILVIDDEKPTLNMSRLLLGASGYNVVTAEGGVEGLEVFRREKPDIVITDMKMPGYHGLEILGRMIDSGMDIPVVVVSAFDQLEHEFVVTAYPRLKFLPKPASPESVAAAIGVFVREARGKGG